MKLEDQFEWDLDTPDPSPENFADVYAKELGLGGEFRFVYLSASILWKNKSLRRHAGPLSRTPFENKFRSTRSRSSSWDTRLMVLLCKTRI